MPHKKLDDSIHKSACSAKRPVRTARSLSMNVSSADIRCCAPLPRNPTRSKPATTPSFCCVPHRLQTKSRQPTDQSDVPRDRRKSLTLIGRRRSGGEWCRKMSRQSRHSSTIRVKRRTRHSATIRRTESRGCLTAHTPFLSSCPITSRPRDIPDGNIRQRQIDLSHHISFSKSLCGCGA